MKDKNRSRTFITTIVFIALAVVGVFLRSFSIKNISEFPMIIDNALLIDHTGATYSSLSLEKIYTSLFSFFFSFVGNKASLAIYFQIILQVISIMLLFYAVKSFSNKITAWACYVISIATPFAFSISIDQFFFMIFALILFLFGLYVQIINKKERSITLKWMFNFVLSLFITRLIFLEPIFVVLVVFGLLVSLIYSDSTENATKTKVICGISYLLGVLLSILSYVGMKYYFFGEKIKTQLEELLNRLFVCKDNPFAQVQTYIENFVGKEIYIYIILGVFLILLIFGYFNRDKKAPILFSILFFMIVLDQLFLETSVRPDVVLGFVFFVLVVLGVQGIILLIVSHQAKKTAYDHSKKEEKNEIENEQKDKVENEEEKLEENLPKINYIENPLPLPKKHVPKTLDYRFDPKPEDMHYDI